MTLVLLSKGDGLQIEKEITVKLFQNGVFHITGVLDESQDADVVPKILGMIREHCPEGLTPTEGTQERQVVLMNQKTRLQNHDSVAREKLYQNLRAEGIQAAQEPSVYPAVKIQFPNERWIAKIFRTGQMILTGMKTREECERLIQQLRPWIAKVLPPTSAESSLSRPVVLPSMLLG